MATPNAGFTLTSWTGTGIGSFSGVDNSISVTMNGPISQSAAFDMNTDALILSVAGHGTVSPNYNGQRLQLGKRFQITAKASPGFVFSNWVGGVFPDLAVITNSAKLSFAMQSSLVLQANFVPNPFVKGNYNGLFADAGLAHHASSGSLSLSVTDRGTYSGTAVIGGTRFSISGQFDLAGHASQSPGAGAYTLVMALDMRSGANAMSGAVSTASWSSDVLAFRAVFDARTNPATAFPPNYPLIPPGRGANPSRRGENTPATLILTSGGKLTITGTLADGTSFRQTAPISQDGD